MGGFPDLSEVAFELSETQQLQDFEVLGFIPQPNLHPHHIFCEMVSAEETYNMVIRVVQREISKEELSAFLQLHLQRN